MSSEDKTNSIEDKINSTLFEINNILHGTQTTVVYVEDEEDVPFWKFFFEKLKVTTKITPAASLKNGLERGKSSVLAYLSDSGPYFLLCVDSDNDYLLQEKTQTSKNINENPFVIQTYTYSIENYKCFSEILHRVVVDATLNDEVIFDYTFFLEEYSKVIYDLFIYFFWYDQQHQVNYSLFSAEYLSMNEQKDEKEMENWKKENEPKHIFPLKKGFCPTISLSEIDISDNGRAALLDLAKSVKIKLQNLPQIPDEEITATKLALQELGLTDKNTYLFIQGHTLYDNVVRVFLNPIFTQLRNKKFDEYNNSSDSEEQKGIKRDTYKKKVITSKNDEMSAIERELYGHKYYEECPFSEKIYQAIRIAINSQKKQ